MSIFSRLFHREPRYHTSAYGTVYAALVARLRREGVHVGGTAGYPRIDCHSFTEGERQDKDGRLRQISCTVECMSNRSKRAQSPIPTPQSPIPNPQLIINLNIIYNNII